MVVALVAFAWRRPEPQPALAPIPIAVQASAPSVPTGVPAERYSGTGVRDLAPDLHVEYLDASLAVTRDRDVVRIEVDGGEVDVSGARLGRRVHLTAGMLLEIPSEDGLAPAGHTTAGSAHPIPHAPPSASTRVAPGDAVDDLLARADAARLSGAPSAAVPLLRTIVEHHATDPRAPLAALTLGRIELRDLASPSIAVSDLRNAIELGLPPALEEDTWVELVEAEARSGDMERARRSFATAMSRHPSSAHEAKMRGWLAPP
jgi:hypothetical protein